MANIRHFCRAPFYFHILVVWASLWFYPPYVFWWLGAWTNLRFFPRFLPNSCNNIVDVFHFSLSLLSPQKKKNKTKATVDDLETVIATSFSCQKLFRILKDEHFHQKRCKVWRVTYLIYERETIIETPYLTFWKQNFGIRFTSSC